MSLDLKLSPWHLVGVHSNPWVEVIVSFILTHFVFDKEVPDTSASAGVYPTSWLVQDDRLGISDKGQGHTEAALHPPGQWGNHRVLDMPQVHIMEQTGNRANMEN